MRNLTFPGYVMTERNLKQERKNVINDMQSIFNNKIKSYISFTVTKGTMILIQNTHDVSTYVHIPSQQPT